MARIPVEQEGARKPWLKWVLILLVIAAAIWLVQELMDPDPEGLGPDDTESVEPLPGAE